MIILSGTLNAYFSGPFNIAASIVMSKSVGITSRIATFFGDILNSIPFFPVFFKGMLTTPTLFNQSVKGIGSITTKIIPLVGQGYYYLSGLFAPIISMFFVRIATRYEKAISNLKNPFGKFIALYISIFCALVPTIYNANIAIKNLCNVMIFYWIVSLRNDEDLEEKYR